MNERRETSDEGRVPASALAGLFSGAVLVALAYASAWFGAPMWGAWSMILGAALCMSAATTMGASNSHVRRSRVALLAAFSFAVILIGFGTPLYLPAVTVETPLVLGLPLPVAIEVYGVGLLPIVVLPILFALEFKSDGLDEAALIALKRRCAAARLS